jgi:hypothetical protein
MKTKTESESCLLMQFKPWAVTVCAALLFLPSLSARGAGVVTDCAESSLRAAMTGGDTVTVACDNTISQTFALFIAKNTVVDASDHQIKISGGNSVMA